MLCVLFVVNTNDGRERNTLEKKAIAFSHSKTKLRRVWPFLSLSRSTQAKTECRRHRCYVFHIDDVRLFEKLLWWWLLLLLLLLLFFCAIRFSVYVWFGWTVWLVSTTRGFSYIRCVQSLDSHLWRLFSVCVVLFAHTHSCTCSWTNRVHTLRALATQRSNSNIQIDREREWAEHRKSRGNWNAFQALLYIPILYTK